MGMIRFLINSVFLGAALAADAFSVTVANTICDNEMSRKKVFKMAGTFGFFQFLMPLLGWICIHTIAQLFDSFQVFIPWIGFALLLFIGIKMILEKEDETEEDGSHKHVNLFVQGIATSIDALTVGFTIADYGFIKAFTASLIIGIITFFLCLIAAVIGKKIGNKFNKKASIIGGVILILIALEIVIF